MSFDLYTHASNRGVSIIETYGVLYPMCSACPSVKSPVITNLEWSWDTHSYFCTNCKKQYPINDGDNGANTAGGLYLPATNKQIQQWVSRWLDIDAEEVEVTRTWKETT